MAIQHVDIPDGQRHEPKGIATAPVDTVYVSDGAAAGAWTKLPATALDADVLDFITDKIDDGSIEIEKIFVLSAVLPDISELNTIAVPVAASCTFIGAEMVLGGTISGADAAINFENAGAASMGTGVTVPFSASSFGNQFSFTPTINNVLTAPTYIRILTDGNSTGAVPLFITLVFIQPISV